jgi:hypothetical protein
MLKNRLHSTLISKIIFIFYVTLLIVFINSGFIKSFSKASNFIEVDFTILSILILIPFFIVLLTEYNLKLDQLIISSLFVLFLLFYSVSALYTSSDSYYIKKLIALSGIVFSFLFALVSKENVKYYFYKFYPLFSLISVSIYYVLTFSNLDAEVLLDFTGNSLVAGEMLGASVLMFYFSKIRYKYALIILSFTVMIALGARGPFLFSFLIVVVISMVNFRSLNIKLLVNIGIFAGLCILFFVIETNNEFSSSVLKTLSDGFSRFELLFSGEKGDSVDSRTIMITKTLEHINNNIFLGTGVGSFGIEVYGVDFRAYPHNVPLEIWFESGLIAFLIFHLFILATIYISVRNKDYLLVSLLVYLYLNMNKSSSLEELRIFFLVAGFALISTNEKHKKRVIND